MFSGIIEEKGTVQGLTARKNLAVLKVRAKKVCRDVKAGSSIAVNGACLTLTGRRNNVLTFDIMRESLDKTTLGSLRPKSKVNLERALKASGRIDGHFVTGHIDGVGTVRKKITGENYTELRIGMVKGLKKYIVEKGSVCLDGVSLTVGKVTDSYLSVYLIPFTKECTTLGSLAKGDQVNIETDILAKYITRLRVTTS